MSLRAEPAIPEIASADLVSLAMTGECHSDLLLLVIPGGVKNLTSAQGKLRVAISTPPKQPHRAHLKARSYMSG